MKKKTLPLPPAMFLDNPEGGEQEMALLYARIETLKKHGEEAISSMLLSVVLFAAGTAIAGATLFVFCLCQFFIFNEITNSRIFIVSNWILH